MKLINSGLRAATVVVVLVVALGAAQHFSLLPQLGNPVKEKEVDRTGPALLVVLEDLSEYHASTAEFSVRVDLEKDVKYVPSSIAGEKVIYEAIGSADGVVDLSDLDAKTVDTTDGTHVTVVVPHAEVGDVVSDVDRSKVVARKRGLVNRLTSAFNANPTSEKAAQVAGRRKLTAAAAESELRTRAERNTKVFLTELLESAGADRVTVRFSDSPA